MAGEIVPASPGDVVRPEEGGKKGLSAFSPEIQRLNAILKLMGAPDCATLTRISQPQIILEACLDGADKLGYRLPATQLLIWNARSLSPGLDGLGRGEAVKCLVAHAQGGSMYPASAFEQDQKPGAIARFIAWVSGRKAPEGGQ